MSDEHFDDLTSTKTTGHEWDGIKELNTPLPRWWLWTFYACIVFAIGYTIFYPAWPLISARRPACWAIRAAPSSTTELDAAKADQVEFTDQIAAMPVADIVKRREPRALRPGRRQVAVQGVLLAVPWHRRDRRGGLSQPQ